MQWTSICRGPIRCPTISRESPQNISPGREKIRMLHETTYAPRSWILNRGHEKLKPQSRRTPCSEKLFESTLMKSIVEFGSKLPKQNKGKTFIERERERGGERKVCLRRSTFPPASEKHLCSARNSRVSLLESHYTAVATDFSEVTAIAPRLEFPDSSRCRDIGGNVPNQSTQTAKWK